MRRLLTIFRDAICHPVTKPWWPWVIACPFLIILAEYLAVAPIGAQVFLWLELPFIIGFMAALLGVFVLPVFFFFRRIRQGALAWWLVCLATVPLFVFGLAMGKTIRHRAFQGLATRSERLVTAIKSYTTDHGGPPENLAALVPDYLDEVPKTGMMAYSNYRYETREETARHWNGNPWVINVFCPSGGINFDRFMYYPLQNYPRKGESGYYERIRDWACYHE